MADCRIGQRPYISVRAHGSVTVLEVDRGVRADPTPAGVPVPITSPGRSVRMLLPYAVNSNTS